MFPSFYNRFETEIGLNCVPQITKVTDDDKECVGFINEQQMSLVCSLHRILVDKAVGASWISSKPEQYEIDVVGPLTERLVCDHT